MSGFFNAILYLRHEVVKLNTATCLFFYVLSHLEIGQAMSGERLILSPILELSNRETAVIY